MTIVKSFQKVGSAFLKVPEPAPLEGSRYNSLGDKIENFTHSHKSFWGKLWKICHYHPCLHNYHRLTESRSFCVAGFVDVINSNREIIPGSWRPSEKKNRPSSWIISPLCVNPDIGRMCFTWEIVLSIMSTARLRNWTVNYLGHCILNVHYFVLFIS